MFRLPGDATSPEDDDAAVTICATAIGEANPVVTFKFGGLAPNRFSSQTQVHEYKASAL